MSVPIDHLTQFLACAHWDRAFGYDDPVAVHRFSYLLSHVQQIRQVCRAVRSRWRIHCQKDQQRFLHRLSQIGRKGQSPAGRVSLDHLFKPRLIDGQHTRVQIGYLLLINVHADHFIAHVGKARPRDKSHVPGAYYCQFHSGIPISRQVNSPIRVSVNTDQITRC